MTFLPKSAGWGKDTDCSSASNFEATEAIERLRTSPYVWCDIAYHHHP